MSDHYPYFQNETISQYLSRLNEVTSHDIPKPDDSRYQQKIGWSNLLFGPLGHLFRSLLSNTNRSKGIRKFIESVMEAVSIVLFRAKRWEYMYRTREGNFHLPPVTQQEIERVRQY